MTHAQETGNTRHEGVVSEIEAARELREDALDECLEHIVRAAQEIMTLTSDGSCAGALTSSTVGRLRALVKAVVDAHAAEKEAVSRLDAAEALDIQEWGQYAEEGARRDEQEEEAQSQLITIAAAGALRTIRSGARLRIPFDGGEPSLVEQRWIDGEVKFPSVPVRPSVAAELLALRGFNQLRRMKREDEGDRYGWEYAGFDGDKADFYSTRQ